jgi:hypothetical protein
MCRAATLRRWQRQAFVCALRFPSYSQTWVAYDIMAYNLSSLRYFRLWLQLYRLLLDLPGVLFQRTSNFSQKILRTRLTSATLTALLRFIAGKKLRSEVLSQPRK